MKTVVTAMFDIDIPLFAFSHCRDVVVEVCKAGGMGVLGAAGFSPKQLAEELRWIDLHVDGKPYGIDLLIPSKHNIVDLTTGLDAIVSEDHKLFVSRLLDEAGIEKVTGADNETLRAESHTINMTPKDAMELLKVSLEHPVKLVVNGLGIPSQDTVKSLQSRGIRVGSLVGNTAQAKAQLDIGIDLIVAQGSEAGGHTGSITSMVLWPQVVDLAGGVPVLAAGGVGRGRQMAAALALGAAGVWCGSIWLGTRESELDPDLRERMFEARAEDAIQTRSLTGKPCRALRSKYTDAWDLPGAPATLPMPLQTLLWLEPRLRARRAHAREWMSYPVGQIVGDIRALSSCREVVRGMLEEFIDSVERLSAAIS